MPWWKIIGFLALGLIGLPLGADLLVESSIDIARGRMMDLDVMATAEPLLEMMEGICHSMSATMLTSTGSATFCANTGTARCWLSFPARTTRSAWLAE